MTGADVKEGLDRVLSWPQERHEDAIEMLRVLEAESGASRFSDDERRAIEESRAQARRGELATHEQVAALFARHRKRT